MTVTIEPLNGQPRDATSPRRLETPALVRRQLARLEAVVDRMAETLLVPLAGPDARPRAQQALQTFHEIYDRRPVRDNSGGSGFNDSLWIFIVAAALDPPAIVESGVHRGHSTWLFRQACPNAALFCFDINLKNTQYTDDFASYCENDWMTLELPAEIDKERSLLFFDDHISHAQRLLEARGRGFRLALFDDNFPADQLYATGGAPVPTLAMLADQDLNASDPSDIVWLRNGKRFHYRYDPPAQTTARSAMSSYRMLPDLAEITRFSLGSGLSLVELDRSLVS